MVDFACTYCGQALQAPEEQRGQPIECTACKHRVIVPRAVVASNGPDDSAAGRSAMGVCPNCLESVPARAMRCSACGKRFFDPNAQPSIFADTPAGPSAEHAANTDQSAAAPPNNTAATTPAASDNNQPPTPTDQQPPASHDAPAAPNATDEATPDEGPAIDFACTKCKHPLSAPASLTGQAIRCPNCGLHERVPKKRFSLRRRRH